MNSNAMTGCRHGALETPALVLQRRQSWFVLVLCAGMLLSSCDKASDTGQEGNATTGPSQSQHLATAWPLSQQEAKALQKSEARQAGVRPACRLDLGGSVFLDLVFVPPGTFPMGSPSVSNNPPRKVKISKGFLIGKYEVTWRQFLKVIKRSEVDRLTMYEIVGDERKEGWRDLPARVVWTVAAAFCDKLSNLQGVRARLVTDAEWEYACRAGTTGLYGEWDVIDDTKANISRWRRDGKDVFTKRGWSWYVPVGRYEPNRWGIHDMMGNADEWCLDTYSDRIDIRKLPPIDPVNRGSRWNVFRVVRGGSLTRASSVFERDGDARSGRDRGIRFVIEIDEAVRGKATPLENQAPDIEPKE